MLIKRGGDGKITHIVESADEQDEKKLADALKIAEEEKKNLPEPGNKSELN